MRLPLARHLRDEAGPLVRGQVGPEVAWPRRPAGWATTSAPEAVALLGRLSARQEPEVRHLRLPDRNGALAKAAG